jgi:hypothetical protein
MRMAKRTFLAAAISVVTAAAAISVPAAGNESVARGSGRLPLLISNCAKAKLKPANVILACGDASFGATGMTWSSWSRKSALGTGTGQLNDCKPNCAQGKTKTAPIQLRLGKPVRCSNGKRIFAKVRYTWTQGAPAKFPDTGSVPLGCKLFGL